MTKPANFPARKLQRQIAAHLREDPSRPFSREKADADLAAARNVKTKKRRA